MWEVTHIRACVCCNLDADQIDCCVWSRGRRGGPNSAVSWRLRRVDSLTSRWLLRWESGEWAWAGLVLGAGCHDNTCSVPARSFIYHSGGWLMVAFWWAHRSCSPTGGRIDNYPCLKRGEGESRVVGCGEKTTGEAGVVSRHHHVPKQNTALIFPNIRL